MSKIKFNYVDVQFNFSSKTKLKAHIEKIFELEQKPLEVVQYIFCNDEYLLSINQGFLNHDTYTDIITFPLQDKNQPIIGEIYISIERVKDNAKQFNTSFDKELVRVVSHGALHLCGFKDKSKAQQAVMRSKEDFYIIHYFN